MIDLTSISDQRIQNIKVTIEHYRNGNKKRESFDESVQQMSIRRSFEPTSKSSKGKESGRWHNTGILSWLIIHKSNHSSLLARQSDWFQRTEDCNDAKKSTRGSFEQREISKIQNGEGSWKVSFVFDLIMEIAILILFFLEEQLELLTLFRTRRIDHFIVWRLSRDLF